MSYGLQELVMTSLDYFKPMVLEMMFIMVHCLS